MTKYLVTMSKEKIIFRKITKVTRPIVQVYDKLYRVDDDLMIVNRTTGDTLIFYDANEQQPYGYGHYLDPEFTKALIDSMKLAKGKPAKLFDINGGTITAIVLLAVIGFALISQVVNG
jgi:hypothetical protein